MKKNLLTHTGFIYTVCIFIFIIALIPLWYFKYFPTLDGPSHLYNASIIRELWFGDKDFYNSFFRFNPQPVPNWTGHLLAVILGIFLPVWLVEKIIVLSFAVGIPFGIISLLKNLSITPSWSMLLLLPFTYTLILYLGFFNFMIALALMFVALAWMIKWRHPQNIFYLLGITVLLILIYFSHVLIFGLTLMFTVMWMLWSNWVDRNARIFSNANFQKLICFVPGLILSAWFFSTKSLGGFRGKVESIPSTELWKMLKEGSPLAGLNGIFEVPFTSVFVSGLGVLLLFNIIWRIKNKSGILTSDVLLIFSLLLLVMYFTIPNGMISGGFISLRLLMLALLIMVSWLLAQKLPMWIMLLSGALGVYVFFSTFSYRFISTAQLNDNADNMVRLVHDVERRKVLLPLNYSGNWLHINLSGYAGASRKIVILDNYEAVTDVFPLQWKEGQAPELTAGNFTQSLNPEISIENYEKATGNKIDYVTRWQFNEVTDDSISQVTDSTLRNHFNTKIEIGEGDLFYNKEIVRAND